MQSAVGLVALALIAASANAAAAVAAVADSSAGGFIVKLSVDVKAPPDEVYRKFVHNVGDWWDPAHTFSGDAHNLAIEERPMGCFCEKLSNGGGVRHLEVLQFQPGKLLVMSGALGPLQTLAAAGTLSIVLSPSRNGTTVDVAYAVSGYLAAGMNTWAAPVDNVLTIQLGRLKSFVEKGSPR